MSEIQRVRTMIAAQVLKPGIDTDSPVDLSPYSMTLLHIAVDFKKMDTRVVERNLERGVIQGKDYDKAVKDLPDDGDNAEYVSIESIAESEFDTR